MKKLVIIISGIVLVIFGTMFKGASGGPGTLATICLLVGGVLFLYGLSANYSKKQ